MGDIAERLRNCHRFNPNREYGATHETIWSEAADEIERLRAENTEVKRLLECALRGEAELGDWSKL